MRIDDAVGKKEFVELLLTYKGKIHKTATRKVFGSQMNHETCHLVLGVPRVRLNASERQDHERGFTHDSLTHRMSCFGKPLCIMPVPCEG